MEVGIVRRCGVVRSKCLSNAELVAGLEAGDHHAFAWLYREYGRLVHRVAWHRLGRTDLADDAMQETMLRAWRAASRLDPARPIAPWLATVATRVAIDIGRREAARPTVPLLDVDVGVADSTATVDTAVVVHAAVATLGAEDVEMVKLHHFDGLTYREVAQRTRAPVGTIKSRSSRVHRQLASLLHEVPV